ncbi:harpin binding protein 1 [Musa troglodytarum]|uniref:Harpin binding protein 1 n=1 Tax=Musa troglodytarum TaxID=320322 RepID=A0A9E7I9N5_9LILI|nr:harpin binding protein 1 [Musa troglodytarum]
MASLLLPHGSSLLSPSSAAAASSSSRHCFIFPSIGNRRKSSHRRKFFLPAAAAVLDESPVFDPSPGFQESHDVIAPLKLKLLILVLIYVLPLWCGGCGLNLYAVLNVSVCASAVSGLNRGLAADEEDLRRAESAAKELEAVGGVVDLTKHQDKLQGQWRLIYSSAFSSRTLGGSRPGPPTGRLLPITLGQVFQRIDVLSKDFDNIVELQFGTPWPLPQLEATAILAHKFELIGTCKIKITFTKTTVKPTGSYSQLPPLEVPRLPDALRPPSNTGSGEFEVTYLDSDTRITRGDRGELRVFVIS